MLSLLRGARASRYVLASLALSGAACGGGTGDESSATASGGAGGRGATDARFTIFDLPTPERSPYDIVVGPDGNLWFTEGAGTAVGRITPAGEVTEFPVGTENSFSMTSGPDGNLWFTSSGDSKLCTITPSGTVTAVPLPATVLQVGALVAGPDGNMWVAADSSVAKVTRLRRSHTLPNHHGRKLGKRDHRGPRRQHLVHGVLRAQNREALPFRYDDRVSPGQ